MSTDSPSPEEPQLPPAPPLSDSDVSAAQPTSYRPLLIGLGAGFLLYVAAFVVAVASGPPAMEGSTDGYWAIGLLAFMILITLVLLVVGVTLVCIRRTRMLGAGLLISIAVGLFVDGGVCIALLAA